MLFLCPEKTVAKNLFNDMEPSRTRNGGYKVRK